MPEETDAKVVLCGKQDVGKTCLINRFVHNTFCETSTTIGCSFATKRVALRDGRASTLAIWDTAGQERFHALSAYYLRGARVAIACYDLTDRASFQELEDRWLPELSKVCDTAGFRAFVVGTKLDLVLDGFCSRGVAREEVLAMAARNGVDASDIFETSAKSKVETVEALFERIAACCAEGAGDGADGSTVRVGGAVPRRKDECCVLG